MFLLLVTHKQLAISNYSNDFCFIHMISILIIQESEYYWRAHFIAVPVRGNLVLWTVHLLLQTNIIEMRFNLRYIDFTHFNYFDDLINWRTINWFHEYYCMLFIMKRRRDRGIKYAMLVLLLVVFNGTATYRNWWSNYNCTSAAH